MHDCDPCGTRCGCGPWEQCVEGPSWPPVGPASRSRWWGIGPDCLPVWVMQTLPVGGPAGTVGIGEASMGMTRRAVTENWSWGR